MIYFDQAATSYYRPDCVVTAVIEALANAGNSSRSATGPSIWSSRIVYEAREKIATLFNAKPENVAFTSGVTESLNLVIASFFNKGHIICIFFFNCIIKEISRLCSNQIHPFPFRI